MQIELRNLHSNILILLIFGYDEEAIQPHLYRTSITVQAKSSANASHLVRSLGSPDETLHGMNL